MSGNHCVVMHIRPAKVPRVDKPVPAGGPGAQLVGIERKEGDGLRAESEPAHLAGNLPTRVREPEIDGLPVGYRSQLAGLKVKRVALLGAEQDVLSVDRIAQLAREQQQA